MIVAINTWAVPLVRYTVGVVKWTQAEMKALDVSTRKLLAMHKCFKVNDDIHRLYVLRKLGGRGLLSVEDVVTQERYALGGYLKSSVEPWLKKVYICGDFATMKLLLVLGNGESKETWRSKPLHGQFLRDVSEVVDQNFHLEVALSQ